MIATAVDAWSSWRSDSHGQWFEEEVMAEKETFVAAELLCALVPTDVDRICSGRWGPGFC